MATYLRDQKNNAVSGLTLPPQALTANTNGVPINFSNGTGRCCATLCIGVINTLTNIAVQITESADNTTYSSISGATITVLNTSSPGNTVAQVTFDRSQPWLCSTTTLTGGTTLANCSLLLEQQKVQT
jgi:hypothetical protein